MITIEIKLVSQYRHHGSSGPKPTKVKSKASSKLAATLLGGRTIQSGGTNANDKSSPGGQKVKKSSLPYGTHDGNIQVQILKSGSITEENVSEFTRYTQNVTAYLENIASFDLKAAKHHYRHYKDDVIRRYQSQFGNELSEIQTTHMLTELAKEAFTYTSHQIVIVLCSDDYFEGSAQNRDDKKYYVIIKSKMIYSEGRRLLSFEAREAMRTMDIGSDVAIRTNIVRIPAIISVNPRTGLLIVSYRGPGTVAGFRDDYS